MPVEAAPCTGRVSGSRVALVVAGGAAAAMGWMAVRRLFCSGESVKGTRQRVVRGWLVGRRSHGRRLAFATISLVPVFEMGVPIVLRPQECLNVCFNKSDFLELDGELVPPSPPACLLTDQGKRLEFPKHKGVMHLGDEIHCLVHWSPPPNVPLSPEPRPTTPASTDTIDIEGKGTKIAYYNVMAWWRVGARCSANVHLISHTWGLDDEGNAGARPLGTAPFSKEGDGVVLKARARRKKKGPSNKKKDMEKFHEGARGAIADLPEKDRVFFMAKLTIDRANERQHICPRCWLLKKCCMCEHWSTIKTSHQLSILMHYKEYRRTSNTGKILLASSPESQLLLFGLREHHDKIAELAKMPNTCVLFPAPDGVSVDEFLQQQSRRPPSEDGKSLDDRKTGLPMREPLHVLVLDGTWNQARTLNAWVPAEIPRIGLSPETVSLFVIRKQSQPDRICTIEAITMLLEELGEPDETIDYLHHMLKTHVNHVARQCRNPEDADVYANQNSPQV